jgi:hypothetical protein
MRPTRFPQTVAATTALLALLAAAGCGSADDPGTKPRSGASSTTSASASESAAAADTSAGEGDWTLAMSKAGGADGETSTTVYMTYNPSTGAAKAFSMPGVQGATAPAESAALLLSTDRRWAIPDTEIKGSAKSSGRLKVYSLTGAPRTLDLARLTEQSDVKPVGWAFDPTTPHTLRVVDTRNRVWTLDVTSDAATQTGTLPKGAWVFLDGFNRNTGEPYVESIESDETKPAGNGVADKSDVTRAGGTVLINDGAAMKALPKSPCRLAGGFTDSSGTSWEFCADSSTVKTYVLAKGGQEWTAYGKPSTAVAPIAAGFPLALPPTG